MAVGNWRSEVGGWLGWEMERRYAKIGEWRSGEPIAKHRYIPPTEEKPNIIAINIIKIYLTLFLPIRILKKYIANVCETVGAR